MSALQQQTPLSDALLQIRDLSVRFPSPDGQAVMAVNSLSLCLKKQETLALVGESGCGKSVTAFSIMQLLQKPGEIVSGEIFFNGDDLLKYDAKAMQQLRGAAISMIFQEPMTSLNPVLKIGFQITEALLLHRDISSREAASEAIALLSRVGIPAAAERYHSYPHQLSGGMKQRAMIAIALACSPQLLIADEPTTALDVTVQAQILDLIDSLKQQSGMSLLLITHNLGIVASHADRTVIMYAGSAVESAPTRLLLDDPLHPYTIGLLASLPQSSSPGKPLPTISGSLSPLHAALPGCPFVSRCPYRIERCASEKPPLVEIRAEHHAACWRAPLND
jgi:peptide/nickel transport system ATP-binding protein